jgi:hypothetical protein
LNQLERAYGPNHAILDNKPAGKHRDRC